MKQIAKRKKPASVRVAAAERRVLVAAEQWYESTGISARHQAKRELYVAIQTWKAIR